MLFCTFSSSGVCLFNAVLCSQTKAKEESKRRSFKLQPHEGKQDCKRQKRGREISVYPTTLTNFLFLNLCESSWVGVGKGREEVKHLLCHHREKFVCNNLFRRHLNQFARIKFYNSWLCSSWERSPTRTLSPRTTKKLLARQIRSSFVPFSRLIKVQNFNFSRHQLLESS